MWRRCVLHGVGGDEQLGGDLGRLEVAGQVSHHAQLGLAELLPQRRRLAAGRRRASGEHVEDRRRAAWRGWCGAADGARAALGPEPARTGRTIPSGSASSSARSIDASAPARSPSRSRAAASSSSAWTVAQRGWSAFGVPSITRRQHVHRLPRAAFRQRERRGGDAHPRRVALVGAEGGERGARRRRLAHQRLRRDDPAAHVHRERVFTLERGCSRSAARNSASASSSRPCPSRTKARA